MDINSLNVKGLLESGCWQIVTENVSVTGVGITVSGLNGDVDSEYKIIMYFPALTGLQGICIQPNGDTSSSNYTYTFFGGMNGGVTSSSGLTNGFSAVFTGNPAGYQNLMEFSIFATSGQPRTCINKSMGLVNGTTVTEVYYTTSAWKNTASNITSLVIGSGTGTGIFDTGSYILVLKRVSSPGTSQGFNSIALPTGKLKANCFETIYETTLGSNQTSVTISGLDGDTDRIWELEIMLVNNGSIDIQVQPNADSTAAHYGYKYFQGAATTASQGSNNANPTSFGGGTTGQVSWNRITMYTKQGNNRLLLSEMYYGATTTPQLLRLSGMSYNVTNTNFTSLAIVASSASGLGTGTFIRLKALKRST